MEGLAQYPYTYGMGEGHNRRIEFYRTDPQDPRTICARIIAFHQGEWIELNEVPGKRISVEILSTTGKMQAMLQARQKMTSPEYPNQVLSSLELDAQNGVLHQLDRDHGRRIEITNDVGGPRGLEKVVQLNIFDPR